MPFFSDRPVKRLDEIEAEGIFEAFSHASSAFRYASDPIERWRIGVYIDQLLDRYLETANG